MEIWVWVNISLYQAIIFKIKTYSYILPNISTNICLIMLYFKKKMYTNTVLGHIFMCYYFFKESDDK